MPTPLKTSITFTEAVEVRREETPKHLRLQSQVSRCHPSLQSTIADLTPASDAPPGCPPPPHCLLHSSCLPYLVCLPSR
ncbi:hypothetical protein E2C01_060457 [Portunus trituberculatus]|uniref:Uncharacterized protein n=1 Tax=Portunus trituberculatus TaxID=210409 RepID=A0A5B7H2J4_PORTR|nr:hypothetical protein [Portunus trituberculatus]